MEYEKSGTFAVSKLACFSLPPSKHRWVSSVLVLPDNFNTSEDNASSKHPGGELESCSYCVICGDRKGSVHVYKLLPARLPGHVREELPADKVLCFFDYTVEPLEDTPETSTSGHLTESQLPIILPLNRTIVFGPKGVHIREVQL